MFNFDNPETFWLNITNIGLGIIIVLCCFAIGAGFYREVRERLAARERVRVARDDHAFEVPGLGLTMADGGERLDRKKNGKNRPNPITSEK